MKPKRIVLAHGLWMPGVEMLPMKLILERDHGIEGELFSYPSLQDSLDGNASRFAAFVCERSGDIDGIVAHSLGGIVALKALALDERLHVPRLVCLGSPLAGCRAARALERVPLGDKLVGPSLCEAAPPGVVGDWAKPVLERVEVGVVAGNHKIGLGRLLARFDEPNDGTVALAETRIDGIADHVVLPVSHTGMVMSADVAAQAAAFLSRGAFEPVA